jgi:hypothetical protein
MDELEHRHTNRVRKRLASCYGLEAAPLTCSGTFLVFLVGLAPKTPSANVGTPGTREVRVL